MKTPNNFIMLTIVVILWAGTIVAQENVQQTWLNHYQSEQAENFDFAQAVAVDQSGNVYVAGLSKTSATGFDYLIVKYDANGAQQWVARYNGSANNDDEITAMAVDDEGSVYVTGKSEGANDLTDFVTVKYDSQGNQRWVAKYDGPGNFEDDAHAIAIDQSGNVYVTGMSMGAGWFSTSAYATVKYDGDGNQLWVARYNGGGNLGEQANAIAVDDAGNVYVTGISFGSNGSRWSRSYSDIATIKYNPDGSQQWVARYNGAANSTDFGAKIAVDSLKNVYVAGVSIGSNGKSDYVVIKYDRDGNEQWVARYDSPEQAGDDLVDFAIDKAGNVYVTGTVGTERFNPNSDFVTVKYNSDGVEQWVARYNGSGNGWDRAYAIAVDNMANVYVTGQSTGDTTATDYVTIKYSSDGVEQWIVHYTSQGSKPDGAVDITITDSGHVFVTGTSEMGLSGSKMTTLKYSQTGQDFSKWKQSMARLESRLSQNYPNPFNASTTIKYHLPISGYVCLTVYNTYGQQVAVLVDGQFAAGNYEVTWDASQFNSGIYFCRLQLGEFEETKKLILLR